jgi:hypothetical protein
MNSAVQCSPCAKRGLSGEPVYRVVNREAFCRECYRGRDPAAKVRQQALDDDPELQIRPLSQLADRYGVSVRQVRKTRKAREEILKSGC